MPAVGKVTVRKVKGDIIVSDESGESYIFPGPMERPLLLDIDPRIDLTKPIYEQVMKLRAKDKAAEAKARKRKRPVKAA